MRIGIIVGSTRIGRVSKQVADYVLSNIPDDGNQYELIDVLEYNLPFFGTTNDQKEVDEWKKKIDEMDGFVFIVAEYNHSLTASLKNALDSAKDEWANKAASIVSYGGAGGARAAEHLRGILAELRVASVRTHVMYSLVEDFEAYKLFTPREYNKKNLAVMFEQLNEWTTALRTVRK